MLKKIVLFFAILGPGIITQSVNNEAGGITTYSLAGANFGYSLLWTLIPTLIMLFVIQEMNLRLGVITGKGLADLIRENFGLNITFYIMLLFGFVNYVNIVAEFAGIAASLELFKISKFVSVPISAFLLWYLITKGTYKSVEKIFLIGCIFFVSYIIACFMVKPNWKEAMTQTILPTMKLELPYIIAVLGIVGATIAPWQCFYLEAAAVEKGVKVERYRYSKLDLMFGCFFAVIIAFFIIVCCSSTLYKTGIKVETAKDIALALKPLAGEHCFILFAFGLLIASLLAACLLPLATAFYICEGMGWEAGVDKSFREAPQFFLIYTFLIITSATAVLFPKFPLVKAMFISQVINAILVPILVYCLLKLTNKEEILGDYKNSRVYNLVVILIFIITAVINIFAIILMLKESLIK